MCAWFLLACVLTRNMLMCAWFLLACVLSVFFVAFIELQKLYERIVTVPLKVILFCNLSSLQFVKSVVHAVKMVCAVTKAVIKEPNLFHG